MLVKTQFNMLLGPEVLFIRISYSYACLCKKESKVKGELMNTLFNIERIENILKCPSVKGRFKTPWHIHRMDWFSAFKYEIIIYNDIRNSLKALLNEKGR